MPIKVTRLIRPSAVTPPAPITDTWTNLLTVAPPTDGLAQAYWTFNCINTNTGQLMCPGFFAGTKMFNISAGTFTNVSPTIWGQVENYKTVYDAVNNRYFVTEQTPSNGNFGGGGGGRSGYLGGNDPGGALGFTPYHFMTPNCPLGIAKSRYLIGASIQGYSGVMDTFVVFDVNNLAGAGFGVTATGDLPPVSSSGLGGTPKEFTTSFDSRTGQLFALAPTTSDANNVQLYICNGILDGAARWIMMPTFGTPPNFTVLQMCYDEYANAIVAWCGLDRWVTDGFEPPSTGQNVRQTWVLPLHSMIWRLGRGISAGDTVPPAEVGSYSNMVYDTNNRQVILTIAGSGGFRVWGHRVGAPTV